eukprot:IDg15323t1
MSAHVYHDLNEVSHTWQRGSAAAIKELNTYTLPMPSRESVEHDACRLVLPKLGLGEEKVATGFERLRG